MCPETSRNKRLVSGVAPVADLVHVLMVTSLLPIYRPVMNASYSARKCFGWGKNQSGQPASAPNDHSPSPTVADGK